jgi:hypothetical protein
MKSNPSQVATSVSINLHVKAPFAGADIDPGTAAIVAEIPRLFKPVLRMALEKLPHSESLSRRSPVQVCRIFVDS